ncbi:uracil phosphoribosyltransferase, partial [Bacillus velezensis]|uniref:uracil phosphoribosyltransferase n=1 Tax=Bacillus velezensis TaxID=492670 RepID=UPI003394B065
MVKLVICDHPLIQHKLTFIRDMRTNTKDFRELVDEVATLMAYEITRDVELETIDVQTPVAATQGKVI